jgi:hypothetical protein
MMPNSSPLFVCPYIKFACDKCGSVLHRQNTTYKTKSGEKRISGGYNCRTFYSVGTTACSSHYIGEKDLNTLVCDDIRKKAGDVLKDEQAAKVRFYAVKSSTEAAKLGADKAALKQTNKRLDELKRLIEAVFEKSVLMGGEADMFAELAKKYADEQRELKAKAEQLTAAIEKQRKAESDVDTFIKLMKKHVNVTELDRATVVELIDHITVSANAATPREVVIYYNFVGNVE